MPTAFEVVGDLDSNLSFPAQGAIAPQAMMVDQGITRKNPSHIDSSLK